MSAKMLLHRAAHKSLSLATLCQVSVEVVGRELGSFSTINEKALAEKLEVLAALSDLINVGNIKFEVQDVTLIAHRLSASERAA